LKIVKSPYLSEKSSDFDEPDNSHVKKIEIFKIQDGGRCHLENRFFGHNLSTDCPILAKFCTRKQIGMPTKATSQKLHFFKKIQDGRRPTYLSKKIIGF